MITLNLVQGTSNWLAARAQHFTASEAPAMLGLSKYKSRSELLREKATGIVAEVDAATQRRFNAGHESESATRVWAEQFIGEDLYPITGAREVDGLPLLASFDGLTLDESINWENKLWNEEFASMVRDGIVPDTHWPQLEQQLLVAEAKQVLFTVSDGGENIAHMWYESIPERRAKLIAGWKQFAEDIKNYVHVEAEAKVVTGPVETLPAIFVTVEGRVADSNLPAFVRAAHEYIDRIQTDLVTDADFETAAKNVNELESGEKRLEAVKANALAQTSSIDELFRAIDQIKGEMKKKRLHLTDLVKTKKESRKIQIVTDAHKAIQDHIAKLEERIGGRWMTYPGSTIFHEAIKGLKSIDSMREKVGNALRNAMLEANMLADTIEANYKSLNDPGHVGHMHLFPDFAAVCTKQTDDFAALLAMRIANHRAEQEKILEAERAKIRAEEQAKAEREAQAKARAEQAERDAEAARLAHELAEREAVKIEAEQAQGRAALAEERAKIEADALSHGFGVNRTIDSHEVSEEMNMQARAILDGFNQDARKATEIPADDGKTLKLGEIGARLGFTITADFMAQLGFQPVATEKSAKLYRASDFGRICVAIINHIQSAMRSAQMAA